MVGEGAHPALVELRLRDGRRARSAERGRARAGPPSGQGGRKHEHRFPASRRSRGPARGGRFRLRSASVPAPRRGGSRRLPRRLARRSTADRPLHARGDRGTGARPAGPIRVSGSASPPAARRDDRERRIQRRSRVSRAVPGRVDGLDPSRAPRTLRIPVLREWGHRRPCRRGARPPRERSRGAIGRA
jgi:hypothetical protein